MSSACQARGIPITAFNLPIHPIDVSIPLTDGAGKALGLLAVRDGNDLLQALALNTERNAAVHQARKAIRRIRSILYLCRKTFGKAARRICCDLAELNAGLSDLRDAHVVMGTVDKLRQVPTSRTLTCLRRNLTTRRELLFEQALADDPDFLNRKRQVLLILHSLQWLPWHRVSLHDLKMGLARSEKHVRQAFHHAMADFSTPSLHGWRRKTRRLLMQLDVLEHTRMLERLHIEKAAEQEEAFREAVRILGARQDLVTLSAAIMSLPPTDGLVALEGAIRIAFEACEHDLRQVAKLAYGFENFLRTTRTQL